MPTTHIVQKNAGTFNPNHPHKHFQYSCITIHIGENHCEKVYRFTSCPPTGLSQDLIYEYLSDVYTLYKFDAGGFDEDELQESTIDRTGLDGGFYWFAGKEAAVNLLPAAPPQHLQHCNSIFSIENELLIQMKSLFPALFEYSVMSDAQVQPQVT